MPQIRLSLRPNLFRRFLYLSLTILNLFITPITFSFKTLSDEIFWLSFLSCLVKGFFLLDFLGNFERAWIFFIPVYPESTKISQFGLHLTRLSLNSLKSCFFPLATFVQMICLDLLSTTIWLLIVCLFFFPE